MLVARDPETGRSRPLTEAERAAFERALARAADRGRARRRHRSRVRRARSGGRARWLPASTSIVLEARDRVGGRVWSRELENGAVVEMGAEFILPGNDTIRAYVERFSARAVGEGHALRRSRAARRDRRRRRTRSSDAMALIEPHGLATRRARGFRCRLSSTGCRSTRARARRSARGSRSRPPRPPTASRRRRSPGWQRIRPTCAPAWPEGIARLPLALAAELGSAVHLSSPVESVALGRRPRRSSVPEASRSRSIAS